MGKQQNLDLEHISLAPLCVLVIYYVFFEWGAKLPRTITARQLISAFTNRLLYWPCLLPLSVAGIVGVVSNKSALGN